MEKKYQVFVSSTYKDLKAERMAVIQRLLDMGCIPVGMEQFPASNMSQMDYIEMMLNDCDYYILILAGKYGSVDADGVGFTEKEYDYAVSRGIPVMSFLAGDLGQLAASKCEDKAKQKKLLEAFRKKVSAGKLVKFYTNIDNLQYCVVTALHRCINDFPAVGWVRGNTAEKNVNIEQRFDEYLKKHMITEEEIDALLGQKTVSVEIPNKAGGKTIIIDNLSHITEDIEKELSEI